MSIKIMSEIWTGGPSGPTRRFVLIAIADNANDEGECWPSIAAIAQKTGLCERAVRMTIRALEAEGWLQTDISAGRKGANKYRITPAPHAPGTTCPPATHAAPPGTTCPPTPAPHAPEPSYNHQEPSEVPPYIPQPEKLPDKMRLPPDWALSDEGWAYARSQAIPDEVIEDEARGFHAYWSDRRDRDAKKSVRGWEQCWANRCRAIAGRYAGRGMAGKAKAGGYGQGGSIASIVARRWASGEA